MSLFTFCVQFSKTQTLWINITEIFPLLFRDVSKFAMHFIVEEIDEDTSMEELQKMMLVALVYRILVCFYEVSTHKSFMHVTQILYN